jgi:hypothetical protein
MIITLAANTPMGVGHYDGVVAINIKQYGAGNLRLSTDRESLLQNIGGNAAPGAILDGITQATADGFKTWFWSGDLWLISDVSGPVCLLAPAYTAYLDKLKSSAQPADFILPSEAEGNLATY